MYIIFIFQIFRQIFYQKNRGNFTPGLNPLNTMKKPENKNPIPVPLQVLQDRP